MYESRYLYYLIIFKNNAYRRKNMLIFYLSLYIREIKASIIYT